MNKKHFEDVWEEAEVVSRENRPEWNDLCDSLKEAINTLCEGWQNTEETEELLGEVLLYLCMITDHKGANSWTALENATNTLRQILLDPDE